MVIQFCPVCRKLLQIKKENEKIIGFCSCGFKRMSGYELNTSEKGENKIIKVGNGVIKEDEFKEKREKKSYEEKRDNRSE